jgi:hypothetical protein
LPRGGDEDLKRSIDTAGAVLNVFFFSAPSSLLQPKGDISYLVAHTQEPL